MPGERDLEAAARLLGQNPFHLIVTAADRNLAREKIAAAIAEGRPEPTSTDREAAERIAQWAGRDRGLPKQSTFEVDLAHKLAAALSAARAEGREEAAKVCDKADEFWLDRQARHLSNGATEAAFAGQRQQLVCTVLAAAIRALEPGNGT